MLMPGDVTFTVTPEVLKVKADSVSKRIREVRELFDEIATVMEGTGHEWIGEAGEFHRRLYREERPSIEEVLKRLSEHPRDLLTIAQEYSDTETMITDGIPSLPTDVIV